MRTATEAASSAKAVALRASEYSDSFISCSCRQVKAFFGCPAAPKATFLRAPGSLQECISAICKGSWDVLYVGHVGLGLWLLQGKLGVGDVTPASSRKAGDVASIIEC